MGTTARKGGSQAKRKNGGEVVVRSKRCPRQVSRGGHVRRGHHRSVSPLCHQYGLKAYSRVRRHVVKKAKRGKRRSRRSSRKSRRSIQRRSRVKKHSRRRSTRRASRCRC